MPGVLRSGPGMALMQEVEVLCGRDSQGETNRCQPPFRHPRQRQRCRPARCELGDLSVGRLGFGAMRITGRGVWGPPPDRAAAIGLLRHAVRLGVTFIDTADSYGPGVSEELIAEALAPYHDGLVIATKGGLTRPRPGDWRPRRAASASARRLRGESEAAAHRPDRSLPVA